MREVRDVRDVSVQAGGCLCGDVRFEIDRSAVISAHHCHCTDCQRSTGSAFATFCIVPEAGFRNLSGSPCFFAVKGTSGGSVERGFCASCGSPLFSRVSMAPGVLFVKAGALDDGSWLEPASSFWAASAQPWAKADARLPIHQRNPG
jgi:hypothetical protein